MNSYSLFHLSDQALAEGLASVVSEDRRTTASLLAHIAEFDARRLYAPAGFSSMHGYCAGVLRLSEGAAFKRIRAARAAREFPQILDMVARGQLHLAAVVLLASKLTHDNATELLAAATHKSKAEVETLIAHRFPQGDVPARVLPLPQRAIPVPESSRIETTSDCSGTGMQLSPGTVGSPAGGGTTDLGTVGGVPIQSPSHPAQVVSPPRVAPLAPTRYAIQFTAGQETRDLIRYAEDLLGHRLDSSEMDQIFAAGLSALIEKLKKLKLAATNAPRMPRKPAHGRTIPADVKRKVWARDGGRCTFVSDDGRRCDAGRFLEFDHIEPVGRGGRSTIENLRLRCRAHNQLEADRVFGAGFMHAVRTGNRSGDSAGRRSSAGP